ncbi:hypothetical protein KEM54_001274, partial [Ascosphaera aggregata]
MNGNSNHDGSHALDCQQSAPDTVPTTNEYAEAPPSSSRPGSSFPRQHSLVGSYPRTSFAGSRNTLHLGQTEALARPVNPHAITSIERNQAVQDELNLLVDNKIICRSERRSSPNLRGSASRKSVTSSSQRPSSASATALHGRDIFSGRDAISEGGSDNVAGQYGGTSSDVATESSPLLSRNFSPSSQDTVDRIDEIWDQAVIAGKIQTSWTRETKVLT